MASAFLYCWWAGPRSLQPKSPMSKELHIPDEDFHLGKLIKAELARQGRTATWLAKQVHCTPENIYKTYRQKWVTMPLLFEISKVLDCDFFKACSEHLEAEKTNL